MRVVIHVAKPPVRGEVLAVTPRFCLEVRRGGNRPVRLAEALDRAIRTDDVLLAIVQPACGATIVLWSDRVERLWGMTAGV